MKKTNYTLEEVKQYYITKKLLSHAKATAENYKRLQGFIDIDFEVMVRDSFSTHEDYDNLINSFWYIEAKDLIYIDNEPQTIRELIESIKESEEENNDYIKISKKLLLNIIDFSVHKSWVGTNPPELRMTIPLKSTTTLPHDYDETTVELMRELMLQGLYKLLESQE